MNTPLILTKENFWNDLYAKHPEQMAVFCKWIDDYKKKNNWDELFRARFMRNDENNRVSDFRTPKFHEIPVAIQIGIFYQFASEMDEKRTNHEDTTIIEDRINDIRDYFSSLEEEFVPDPVGE